MPHFAARNPAQPQRQKRSALRFSHFRLTLPRGSPLDPFTGALMASRHTQPKERLTKIVRARVSDEAMTRLEQIADQARLTVSELVRRKLEGVAIHSSTDMTTVRALRQTAGLLKLVHTESGGAYSEQTAAMLRQVELAIVRIAQSHDL